MSNWVSTLFASEPTSMRTTKPLSEPSAAKPRPAAVATKRVRRSKGRPKRDDPKVGADTLILRTCELLQKERPHKITIAAVARHAGVNRALIRYYFGDRSSLMIAVARHLMKERADIPAMPTTPESAERIIRRTLKSLIDLHHKYPSFRELVFNEIMNMRSPAAQQLFSDALDQEIARMRSMLALLRGHEQSKTGNPNLEAALLHLALIGMGESYASTFKIVEAAAGPQPDRGKVDDQFVDFIADMILNGMRKHP
jgi:AcrR family transcriptional regulator